MDISVCPQIIKVQNLNFYCMWFEKLFFSWQDSNLRPLNRSFQNLVSKLEATKPKWPFLHSQTSKQHQMSFKNSNCCLHFPILNSQKIPSRYLNFKGIKCVVCRHIISKIIKIYFQFSSLLTREEVKITFSCLSQRLVSSQTATHIQQKFINFKNLIRQKIFLLTFGCL